MDIVDRQAQSLVDIFLKFSNEKTARESRSLAVLMAIASTEETIKSLNWVGGQNEELYIEEELQRKIKKKLCSM